MAKQTRRATPATSSGTKSRQLRAKTVSAKTSKANGAQANGAKTNGANTTRVKTTRTKKTKQRWSQEVTDHSNALDLTKGVFTLKDPKKIAASLKASAEHSRRRKSGPYRSALSMLIFYMNRGGKNLPVTRKRILQRAKRELRHQFGRA